MPRVSTYLNFPRSTEQAFLFYRSVSEASSPANPGQPPLTEADRNLVMHVELPILGGRGMMETKAPESMGFSLTHGNNACINLEPDTRAETDRLFSALSEGGKADMPLQEMFWGGYFVQLCQQDLRATATCCGQGGAPKDGASPSVSPLLPRWCRLRDDPSPARGTFPYVGVVGLGVVAVVPGGRLLRLWCGPSRWPGDPQQLDLVDEGCARLDERGPALVAVRKVGGADEPALAADLDELEGFGPALDHRVQRHRRGLTTLHGAVEDRAVGQSSFVLDRHRISGLGRRSSPRRDRDHDQAGGGFGRARLPGRLVGKDLARLLLSGGHRGRASLLELFDLRAIGLEVDLRRFVEAPIGEARLDQFQFRRAQIEWAQAAVDGQTESIEGLLLFGLELGSVRRRVDRGGEDEDSRQDHECAHGIPFSREFNLAQWPPCVRWGTDDAVNIDAV